MDVDRFKAAWHQQPLEGLASRSLEETMREVRNRAARFHWRVTVRDLLDTVACLAIIGIVGPYFWRASQMLEKVGAAILMAGAIWIIVRLTVTRLRHRRLPVDATTRDFYANDLKRVDEQIHLISTAAIWGAAPLMVGGALIALAKGTDGLAVRLALVAFPGVLVYLAGLRALKDGRLQRLRDDLARAVNDVSAPRPSAEDIADRSHEA